MWYEYKLYSCKSLIKNCASLVFNVVAEGRADQLITLLESQLNVLPANHFLSWEKLPIGGEHMCQWSICPIVDHNLLGKFGVGHPDLLKCMKKKETSQEILLVEDEGPWGMPGDCTPAWGMSVRCCEVLLSGYSSPSYLIWFYCKGHRR